MFKYFHRQQRDSLTNPAVKYSPRHYAQSIINRPKLSEEQIADAFMKYTQIAKESEGLDDQ